MRCKQMLSLSVVTVLLAASLAGCGTSSTAPSSVSSEAPSSAASSAASEVTETAALPDGVYTAEFATGKEIEEICEELLQKLSALRK